MNGAIAIASVTASLKQILGNGLTAYGDVKVSAIAPDRVATGENESSQLNLFMYRVAPHAILSQSFLEKGKQPKSHKSRLALDLNYLITAYGTQDFQSEILLGRAIQLFHETPTLSVEQINKAADVLLPTQVAREEKAPLNLVESIKITPQFLAFEEMSKLWSALQTRYRPSVAYLVSTVII